MQINNEMKEYYENWEILDRIDKIDNQIRKFRTQGNIVRSGNEDLKKNLRKERKYVERWK